MSRGNVSSFPRRSRISIDRGLTVRLSASSPPVTNSIEGLGQNAKTTIPPGRSKDSKMTGIFSGTPPDVRGSETGVFPRPDAVVDGEEICETVLA